MYRVRAPRHGSQIPGTRAQRLAPRYRRQWPVYQGIPHWARTSLAQVDLRQRVRRGIGQWPRGIIDTLGGGGASPKASIGAHERFSNANDLSQLRYRPRRPTRVFLQVEAGSPDRTAAVGLSGQVDLEEGWGLDFRSLWKRILERALPASTSSGAPRLPYAKQA